MTSSEQEFLNNYHPEDYEKPSVAVDLLVFTIEDAALKLVMIRREEMPFQNKLALPGVFGGSGIQGNRRGNRADRYLSGAAVYLGGSGA